MPSECAYSFGFYIISKRVWRITFHYFFLVISIVFSLAKPYFVLFWCICISSVCETSRLLKPAYTFLLILMCGAYVRKVVFNYCYYYFYSRSVEHHIYIFKPTAGRVTCAYSAIFLCTRYSTTIHRIGALRSAVLKCKCKSYYYFNFFFFQLTKQRVLNVVYAYVLKRTMNRICIIVC